MVKVSGKFFNPIFFATLGQEINILTHFMPKVWKDFQVPENIQNVLFFWYIQGV